MDASTLPTYCVGIDWGRFDHHACCLDASGEVLQEKSFAHQSESLGEMVSWLLQITGAPPAQIKIALEVSSGPLVVALQAQDLNVYSINPKQSERFRDLWSVAGAKDDRREALVLARTLHSNENVFRAVPQLSHEQQTLRALVRQRERHVADRVRLTHRLEELLWSYFPALLALTSDLSQRWFLQLLQWAACPAKARRLSWVKVRNLLQKHRIRRIDARQVLQILAQDPLPGVNPEAPVQSFEVKSLARQITVLVEQIKDCEKQTAAAIETLSASSAETDASDAAETSSADVRFSDADILRSVPGLGPGTLAVLLAEAASPIENRDYPALRALSGVAPVTKSYGKKKIVCQHRSVNRRLQKAWFHWAHNATLRCVGDRLLNVTCCMLRSNTLFASVPAEAVKAA